MSIATIPILAALTTTPLTILWTDNDAPWPSQLAVAVAGRLPSPILERAGRYRGWQDRQGILLGRLLLQAALEAAGILAPLDEIKLGPHGKPGLAGAGDFSIAHAGGRVLCVRVSQGRVGIDVEPVHALDFADYDGVLSRAERDVVARADDGARCLLQLWTRKEAVAKAAGLGLTGPALPETPPNVPATAESHVTFAGSDWYLQSGWLGAYAYAVAYDRPDTAWRLVRCRLDGEGRTIPCE